MVNGSVTNAPYLCDAHLHTEYSYDSSASLRAVCEAAIKRGLDEICITDHYDANLAGKEPDYDADAAERAVKAIAAEYDGRLMVGYGLERGEAHEYPDCTRAMLAAHDFDFVIGSLHNNVGAPDFYLVPFEKMSDGEYHAVMREYFETTLEMLDVGGFNSLGHLGYPWRLSVPKGHPADPDGHRAVIDEIYRVLIREGVALEVNASGLRKEVGVVHPLPGMIARYRELGGRLVTIGSDAHRPEAVGDGIREVHAILRDVGFTEYTVFRGGKPYQMKLLD